MLTGQAVFLLCGLALAACWQGWKPLWLHRRLRGLYKVFMGSIHILSSVYINIGRMKPEPLMVQNLLGALGRRPKSSKILNFKSQAED